MPQNAALGRLAAFELLPSWQLGFVRLESTAERTSICQKIPKLDNPPDPTNPKVRLPARLGLTVPASDPGGSYVAHVTLTLEPYEGQLAVCHEADCRSPSKIRMTISAWIQANELWWKIEQAAGSCPDQPAGKPDPEHTYTITAGGRTRAGTFPGSADDAGKDPCEAMTRMARWIRQRILTMHPP